MIRNVEALSQRYRVYAVDTISEPNKSILTRPISFDQRRDFVDWLEDLFNGLQINSVYLVGNSFGGFLALNAALYLPEHVKKIVLISPAATFVPIPAWSRHFIPANIIGLIVRSNAILLKPYEWIWQDFPKEEYIRQCAPPQQLPVAHAIGLLQCSATMNYARSECRFSSYRRSRSDLQAGACHPATTRLVPNLIAEIVPNANHIAEYTASDVVNQKILDFFLH